jgi:hypothetical protein
VGSDGIFYRVRHDFGILSLPVGPAVVPPPPSSILEAIDLDRTRNARLIQSPLRDWLRNSVLERQSTVPRGRRDASGVYCRGGTTNLVPVPVPQSRLYIIPTRFRLGRWALRWSQSRYRLTEVPIDASLKAPRI